MNELLEEYAALRQFKPHVDLARKYKDSNALLCYCVFRFMIDKIMELFKKTGSKDQRLQKMLFSLADDAKAIKNERSDVIGSDEKNKEAMLKIITRLFEDSERELKKGKPDKALMGKYLECGRMLDIFAAWGQLSLDLESKSTFTHFRLGA